MLSLMSLCSHDAELSELLLGRNLKDILVALTSYANDHRYDNAFMKALAPIITDLIVGEVEIAAGLAGGSVNASSIAELYMSTLELQIVGINQTTIEQIRAAIMTGLANGATINEIASEIDNIFDHAQKVRAMTIARTEVLGATNFAALQTYKQIGVPYKRWLATLDERTRDTHADAHGQTVPIDEKFDVGGHRMNHPGDPSAPAKEVINCRCTLTPEYEASERGLSGEQINKVWWDFYARSIAVEKQVFKIVQEQFEQQHADTKKRLGL